MLEAAPIAAIATAPETKFRRPWSVSMVSLGDPWLL